MNSNQTITQFLNVKTFPFETKDDNGKPIYYENSYGFWRKKEYDSDGNLIYYENSSGNWIKKEYDCNGNLIYYEDSIGLVRDYRPKPVLEITLEEIAALKGVNVSQIRIKE